MRSLVGSLLLTLSVLAAARGQPTALHMPVIFASNMVLQQAPLSANVWGWAVPGETVNVSISSVHKSTVADLVTGQWSTLLDPQPGSGPWTLSVSAASGSVSFSNVLFGDVYICSGQSNMQMTVNMAFNATAEIQDAANYPNIRLFTVQETIAYSPQLDLVSEAAYGWGVNSPTTITSGKDWTHFSATCYFFAREISRAVPGLNIGLIATDWGGTYIQAWSSPDALAVCNHSVALDPAAQEAAKPFLQSSAPEDSPNQPSVLWNAMIYPLLNMTVRGAAWYQGEANAGDPNGYACMFPAMISDWRAKFNQDLPFFFVQLAAYPDGQGMYAAQRWAQTAALNLPLVGMGTAVDLGDPSSPAGSIHPRNKQEVGRRLALNALAVIYGVDVVRQGPSPAAVEFANSGKVWYITVSFDSVPSANLTFVDTEFCTTCCAKGPAAFEVQDATSTWYPTPALLQGTKALLKLTLGAGDHPVAVRYAWSDYPQCVVFDHTSFLPGPPFVLTL